MKKFYILLLCGLMCTASMFAQSGNIGSITWSISGGTLTIGGTGATPDFAYDTDRPWHTRRASITHVQISNGVTGIGEMSFIDFQNITSVTIPSSVTSIGSGAFMNCFKLMSISIPSSVTYIGKIAFASCTGLSSLTIPASVITIDEKAFANCTALTSLTIPPSVTSIGEAAFSLCSSLTEVNYNAINCMFTFADMAAFYPVFASCSSLKTVRVGSGVIKIPDYAFYQCAGLTSVSIANTVTTIGSSAFNACSGLTSVTIPTSVTNIGDQAFYFCEGLTSMTVPASVTSVGYAALASCTNMTSINVASGNLNYSSIGGVMFNKSQNTLVQFPAGKTGAYTIPSSVTTIADVSFQGCKDLTSVAIPNSVTTIGIESFSFCKGLTSVTFPNSIMSISAYAFLSCPDLTSVTIPASVASIGEYAFGACGALNEIINQCITPQSITPDVFYSVNVSACKLEIPCASVSQYQTAAVWKDFDIQCPTQYYTVTFDARGGTVAPTSKVVVYNEAIGSMPTPIRSGFVFTGWALYENGNGMIDENTLYDIDLDATVYAQWTTSAAVTSVTVSPNSTSVQKGQTCQFAADVTTTGDASTAVIWSVSGKASATTTISSTGLLTVAAGETAATLTVTATSTFDGSKSGNATVTLTNAPVTPSVTSVAVSPISAIMQKGKTQQFTALVTVKDKAPTEIVWSVSGNAHIATYITTDGRFTIATDETATTFTITATSVFDPTKKGTATVTVGEIPTGTSELIAPALKIYPNPFTGTIYLADAEGCTLQVINAAGVAVCAKKVTSSDETLRLEHLSAGVYFFRFEKEGKTKTLKAVKLL